MVRLCGELSTRNVDRGALPLAERDTIENPMEFEPEALIPEVRSIVQSTEL
jgi:hypothetical protein